MSPCTRTERIAAVGDSDCKSLAPSRSIDDNPGGQIGLAVCIDETNAFGAGFPATQIASALPPVLCLQAGPSNRPLQ